MNRTIWSRGLFLVTLCAMAAGTSSCQSPPAPKSSYVPAEEAGVMTVGLDDHDYDLVAAGISREMFERGLPRGYTVVLGPVDTHECPYDIRVRQLQKSLMVLLNKENTIKFMTAVNAMTGGSEIEEIYKLMEFNWFNRNPIDIQDLQTFGKLAHVNGILFGRVSCLERSMDDGGTEITYRFVWELSNTETGLLEIAHEEKIRKNIRD